MSNEKSSAIDSPQFPTAQTYEVLSPRGDVDPIVNIPLQPRLNNLDHKTIGMLVSFKQHWLLILEEVERQLKARYPNIRFSYFRYTKDLNSYTQVAEIAKDPEVRPLFEKWLRGVDAVISANGDAGSCTLYLTYNTTLAELLGKPAVMTVADRFMNIAKSAASLRGVPALRCVEFNLSDLSVEPDLELFVNKIIPETVSAALDDIVAALTGAITPEEQLVPNQPEQTPRIAVSGTLQEINTHYYKQGWSYGMPVMPPTQEAVREMLQGTDLAPDYLVARIPPLMGKATIEKIAVNGVMAGCLPTHMPVLIAAVEALVDPRMWIEAYTCSLASWAPMLIVNGPIRNQISVNSKACFLSPYFRSNAAIAHAVSLIIMNIAGIRCGVEDMAIIGHEGRFGICFGENEEDSPWEGLHEYMGLSAEDSAITVFWPNTRTVAFGGGHDAEGILTTICDSIPAFGSDPGCAVLVCPESARILQSAGYSRKDVLSYIVEYARRPASAINLRWMKGNNHIPPQVPLPVDSSRSVRKFFSALHLPIVVAGQKSAATIAFYGGGGDHGGPITKKINLPKKWDELVARYRDQL